MSSWKLSYRRGFAVRVRLAEVDLSTARSFQAARRLVRDTLGAEVGDELEQLVRTLLAPVQIASTV
jgi:hypothetical protein